MVLTYKVRAPNGGERWVRPDALKSLAFTVKFVDELCNEAWDVDVLIDKDTLAVIVELDADTELLPLRVHLNGDGISLPVGLKKSRLTLAITGVYSAANEVIKAVMQAVNSDDKAGYLSSVCIFSDLSGHIRDFDDDAVISFEGGLLDVVDWLNE